MATIYNTRKKCNAEDPDAVAGDPGFGKGWHYIFDDQIAVDENVPCPIHGTDDPVPLTEFFAIEGTEET